MFGCDPSYALLNSSASAAAQLASAAGGAEFVVFTGDFVRHWQDRLPDPYSNVTDTVENVTRIIGSFFPTLLTNGKLSVGILGNDDSPLDYEINITTSESSNPWFSNLYGAFARAGAAPPGDYSYGGFWETELGNLTILSIDTLIYSVSHIPNESDPLIAAL
jgi:hypothetical protein